MVGEKSGKVAPKVEVQRELDAKKRENSHV